MSERTRVRVYYGCVKVCVVCIVGVVCVVCVDCALCRARNGVRGEQLGAAPLSALWVDRGMVG